MKLRNNFVLLSLIFLFSFVINVNKVIAAEPPPAPVANWTPPVGIPAPRFGIAEKHTMYVGQTFAGGNFAYKDAGNGPYTHYVDNSVACSDTNAGGYGSHTAPRCTIPPAAAPGAVIEIHGGPYTISSTAVWYFPGTSANPVFMRGIGYPSLVSNTGHITLHGSYFIMEGLVLDNLGIYMGTLTDFSFRNNELKNLYSTAIVVEAPYTVFYNNHVHHNGNSENTVEADYHGFKVTSNNSWIVDNHIHHNGGDSIQIGDANGVEPWPHHIYIGRNIMHDDRENAVDIKKARDIIVSQNTAYSYQTVSSASGEIIVVHDGAQKIYIINNALCCSDNGIVSTAADILFIFGNIIFNINGPDSPGSLFAPSGIHIRNTTSSYVINNTLWNVENGISSITSGVATYILNNIIGNVFGNTAHHIALANTTTVGLSTIDKNDLYGTSRLFNIGGTAYNSTTTFNSAFSGKCTSCLNSDPLFVNSASYNFALTASSPLINRGVDVGGFLTSYQSSYGASIANDISNNGRPQSAWDIGALEFVGTPTPSPTPDPTPTPTPTPDPTPTPTPTPGGSQTIPNAPTLLTVTSVSPTQIDLSWNDNSNNEDYFKIEVKVGDGIYNDLTFVNSNISIFRHAGLNPNTSYSFKLRSYNGAGYSSYSNEVSTTTLSGVVVVNPTPTPTPTPIPSSTGTTTQTQGNPSSNTNSGNPVVLPTPPVPNSGNSNSNSNLIKKNIGYGLRNDDDVRVLQKVLVNEGLLPTTGITGNYYNDTYKAVIKYQEKYGLQTTGYVGPLTRAKILVATSSTPTAQTVTTVNTASLNLNKNLYLGLKNSDVLKLQNKLISEGYLKQGSNSGFFGPLTMSAVKAYQSKNGLPQTGYVGPATRAILNK